MTETGIPPAPEARRERHNRIRIGVTGLAFVFVLVLLAASFTGTATSEPELTADTRTEAPTSNVVDATAGEAVGAEDPLAEIGVAPTATTEEGNEVDPGDIGVTDNLEEIDTGARR